MSIAAVRRLWEDGTGAGGLLPSSHEAAHPKSGRLLAAVRPGGSP